MWIETGDGGRKWENAPGHAVGIALLIAAIVTAPIWLMPGWIRCR